MASVLDGKKAGSVTVLNLQKILEEQEQCDRNDRLKTLTWKVTHQVYNQADFHWKK